MNRGAKIGLISVGIIAVLGTVVYFIWFRKKGDKENQNPKGDLDGDENQKKIKKEIVIEEKKSNPKRYTQESRPLKKYDYGNNVKCLQKLLNWRGYTDNHGKVLVVDGKWGNSTEQAIDKSITDGVDWGITKGTGGITISTLKDKVANTAGVQKGVPLVGYDYLKDNPVCKGASCCASVVQTNIPEENIVPLYSEESLYTINPNDPYPYYNPPAAIDSTYVHIEPIYDLNFGGLWFNEKNMLI